MKSTSLYAILLACLSTIALAQNDWTKVDLGGEHVIDCAFPDTMHGYVTTLEGMLWKSSDGGVTWSSSMIFPCFNCIFYPRFLFFFPNNVGKVFAKISTINGDNDVLFNTTDGGLTWDTTIINSPLLATMDFKTSTEAFAFENVNVGPNSWDYELQILKTSDGGKTWQIIHRRNGYGNISFKDTNVWLLSKSTQEPITKGTYLTLTGGKTWEMVDERSHSNLSYVKNGDCFACATYVFNTLEKTHDDGNTWEWINPSSKDSLPCYYEINFLDSIIGYYSVLRPQDFRNLNYGKSTSGGKSWRFGRIGKGGLVKKIIPATASKSFAVTDSNLYVTNNGGGFSSVGKNAEQEKMNSSPSPAFTDINFTFPQIDQAKVLEVFDALGRRMAKEIISPQTTSLRLDIRSYPSGVYFARLGEKTIRFIKK